MGVPPPDLGASIICDLARSSVHRERPLPSSVHAHVVCPPAMESHGECEIKVQLNCSHCQMQSCKQEEDTRLILCLCDDDEVLASDNVTCIRTIGV